MTPLLWFVLVLILLVAAAGVGLSFHFTRRGRLGETHSPAEFGLTFEEVEFKAADGLRLRGVWIPVPGSDKAVIILHGHGSSYDADVYRATALVQAGYSVLLFDFRAHGRSDGRRMTFGYEERQDVYGAIAFLRGRGMEHIGLLGFSYGGIVSMLAAPHCPEVEAIITDGGPGRWMTGVDAWGKEKGLPSWLVKPLGGLFFAVTSLRVGANLFRYDPILWVGRISPRPILFIHGELDPFCADFDDLYAAARQPKEVWRLPDAGHTAASQLYPEEHTRRVIDFFDRHMGQPV